MSIYYDDNGYPVTYEFDGGDSSVRAGLLSMMGKVYSKEFTVNYEISPGMIVRHPTQFPWNNPKNYTRDQLLCFIAGVSAAGQVALARRIFWSRLKSLFFSQSVERDKPGSKKLPYPHSFYKDSNPEPTTYPFWKKAPPAILNYKVIKRNFDYADVLFPNHIWVLIKAAKLYPLYWFGLIGIPFYLLTLIGHSLGKHHEENQMICESYVMGPWALKLFKLINKNWAETSYKYWSVRQETEYHNLLVDFMEKY